VAARWLIALVTTALLVGCGGSEDEPTSTPTATEPPAEGRDPDGGRRPAVGDGEGGIKLQQLGEFDQPVHVAQPPSGDDALFVVEQCGRVLRLEPGGRPETFLDLGALVTCGGEQGLLSVAFAPDYERSGLLYVNYTDAEGASRTVEYARLAKDLDAADPDSARELLRIDDFAPNHNGGLLLFGPDGNLYLGMGDGGGSGDPERTAQDLGSLLGKLIRIDPRGDGGRPYGIPEENPFRDREGGRPEILAYGLRNPWRFSFDRETDQLWIGDVGQNTLEEINGPIGGLGAGANFGWSAFEGSEPFNPDQQAADAISPTLVYGRDRGCSVTGGYVVRDRELRSLYGRYLYGDYCQGELRSFIPRPGGTARDDRALGPTVPSLSSFGEDAAGHLYATSLEGPVYRLRPPG
jgi:glucose/arabinose dehydrogenase